jgi:putative FmdB family regulatory protein
MPIYEYRCESCGHEHEELQKISDAPLKECPECGESALKRLISAPSFRLKGSGWYETDFKSDKDKKRNLAESGDGAKGEASAKGEVKKESDASAKDTTKKESKASDSTKAKDSSSKRVGSGNEAA